VLRELNLEAPPEIDPDDMIHRICSSYLNLDQDDAAVISRTASKFLELSKHEGLSTGRRKKIKRATRQKVREKDGQMETEGQKTNSQQKKSLEKKRKGIQPRSKP